MIKLEKVNKYFNKHKKNELHVINNTSLELPDTGLIALLGPSGCGKTTLLNAIGGLDKVKSGNIYVNNHRITKRCTRYVDRIRNLNIGYIFQNYYLIDNKTVFDNVALSLKMVGIKDKKEIKNRVNYVLDTLGIYRYRNRMAGNLSGGERQRVGIARAIVKDPSIIIADEPTGNLDSANTIEIMNIIKSISKTRMVLLVTHENDIAKFYADRIIEIEDGIITKDYINKHNDNLDYRIDNKIYLKDFKYNNLLTNENNEVNIYNDKDKKVKLTIIVKNNNIYIKGSKEDKIEVIDNDSNIELINEHYKQIDKSVYEKYEFDFASVIGKNEKLRYSSIFNPITLLVNGFKKLLDYSFIKKLLLFGFLASGSFIMYSVSNMFGITNIKDEYFIDRNKNYYEVSIPKVKVDVYSKAEAITSNDYILPGTSLINFRVEYKDYYQTKEAVTSLEGSLTSLNYISSDNLIYGRMPSNKYEIVVDKMSLQKMMDTISIPKQVGIKRIDQFINRKIELKYMDSFTIVGITDLKSPSIYTYEDMMINMLANSYSEQNYFEEKAEYSYAEDFQEEVYYDYNLVTDLNMKKGRLPENDYEVIVNITKEYTYPIDKTIDNKINDKKLTVVGYYESNDINYYLVNSNTIKYNLINNSKNITVMPLDINEMIKDFNDINLNINSAYENSLNNYKEAKKDSVNAALIVSGVILLISFIEIYLMIRASFLSRIKEIGTYRAIGVKKSDIYKMFYGEIFAITTIGCLPGVFFISYALKILQTISYFEQNYMVTIPVILFSIILIYVFNLIIGLLPILRVVSQTPANILSRKDLE